MVGKNQVQITGAQFTQGLATSDYTNDGGIGTSSTNITLVATPGVIRATPSASTTGTALQNAAVLASCEDPTTGSSSTYARLFVDDDGGIYTVTEDGAVTLQIQPSSTTGFTDTITDMVAFNGNAYVSKTSNIMQVTLGSPFILDETWWTGTKSQSPLVSANTAHPMLVFEQAMWIADSNKLHSVSSGGTVVNGQITLGANDRIQALGIDPNTGLMLVGITTYADIGENLSARYFIGLHDGFSTKLRRRIPVEDTVTSFRSVGGQTFVVMGNSVGVWNGAGVTFLRRLTNVTRDSTRLPYKNRVTHFQNTLVICDGRSLLAYGEVLPGKKVWYPLYYNSATTDNLNFAAFIGNASGSVAPISPNLLVNYGTTALKLVKPFNTSTAASGVYYAPNINFERPIFVRRVRVFTTGITTTAGIGKFEIIDETGASRTSAVNAFKVLSANSPQYVFDFDYGGLKLQTLQPKLTLDTQAFGAIRLIIYYDVAE